MTDSHDAEAQRCLEYAKASAFLCELVASAPPFTAEQALKLRAILTSPAGSDATPPPDVVYYAERDGLIKIGTSTAVQRRIHELAAVLLTTEPGGRKEETQRHRQFAASWVHGEWFRPDEDLLRHIEALMS